ncbi:hypothetical protein Tco_1561916 [Tanacetum coccineum]
MTTLKFADTHNMVVFLAKPAKSEGFEQIVDFLNAHTIKYALTINLIIYTSCIEKFWATIKAKTVNGEVQLQALVDGKKIIIIESIVRRDLQLEDAEGVDCLPNATIFEQLTLMGSKTTAWNEFSSTMASAIICLATNQKFNFSKNIFESMVKNLENVSGKFLMYPRVGKGVSGRITPLFPTMVVHNQEEIGEGSAMPTDPHHTPTSLKRKDTEVPQPSGPTTNVADEDVNEEMDASLVRAATTASSLKQSRTVTRSENVSKLSNDPLLASVLNLETTKTTQANEIASLNRRVKKLEQKKRPRTHGLKRLYKVGSSRRVESFDEEDMFGVNDLDGDEVIVDNINVVKTTEETRSVVEEVTAIIEKAKLVSAAEEIVNAAATTVSTTSTILVTAPTTTTTTTTTVSDVEITLAQALAELKSAASTRPNVKGIVINEQEQAPTPTKMSKKDLLRLDEELAFKLQAEEEEEERLAREKAQQIEEANIAWDDIHAKIEADY